MSNRAYRLSLESLESRRLLSADLADGVLTIVGTKKSDVIEVSVPTAGDHIGQLQVDVNGTLNHFNPAQVTSIRIQGLNGNDEITVASDIVIATWINGGNGNDTINGGGGDDTILGENGKDVVHGGEGDDEIFGGNGNDQLFGDGGDDYIDGGNGKDSCNGGLDDDRVKGGKGKDLLDGGAGNNQLDSDKGKDTKLNGTDSDFELELKAALTGDTGKGEAEYESEIEDGVTKRKFELEVEDLTPNTTYDVTIGVTVVAQITTNGAGDAKLKFSTSPKGPNETLMPDGFPEIAAGNAIAIGTALNGTFAVAGPEEND